MEKEKNAIQIFKGLVKTINADYFCNPLLKTTSRDYKAMVNGCFDHLRPIQEDNERLRELNLAITPVSRLYGRILEKFGGYNRIK